ncbi:hypothetical protein BDZ89DRAFT_943643 [Hymenopellis radicata]|nr:hypothetical protein BDZ89DRAFT_943643 [Hymenopellis radicata]
MSQISKLCCTLVIWFNLKAGISRDHANTLLRALQFIIATLLHTLSIALRTAPGFNATIPTFHLPRDLRTAYNHDDLDPTIIRTICCPGCYSLMPKPVPWKCQWRESPRSRPCGETLWRLQRTPHGTKWVPKCCYNTQDFESWLQFFLGRREIEEQLEKVFMKDSAGFGADMHDIHDSPAWKDLQDFLKDRYHLVFGFYIDWFNPYTNKIAGKVVSCGALLLYCMNLPLELRYLPENTFIIGIIPPPHTPDPVTISHILTPFIDSMLMHRPPAPPRQIPTYRFPTGVDVQTEVIPVLADLQAIRKVGGFVAPSGEMFCSFCDLPASRIEELDPTTWNARSGVEVREQAQVWLNLTTKSARTAHVAKTGVRWTALHRLPEWDPVKHLVLGFLHNWLEGILQHQLRRLWGIGRDAQTAQNLAELEKEETFTEEDIWESEDELEDLRQEAAEHDAAVAEALKSSQDARSVTIRSQSSDSITPLPAVNPDEDDPMDANYKPEAEGTKRGPFTFEDEQLQAIRTCIQEVSLPTWVSRPPGNLGEPGHGKLKAEQYLTLFTIIFPLIIPEFWWTSNHTEFEDQLLASFVHLVACTNIVASYKTSNAEADAYMNHYIPYRSSLPHLYPDSDPKSMFNHHYAMHNGDLLKYWGPLAALSEFAGERMNGLLQKINTNSHLSDLDLTMLRQMARRCRLEGRLHDNQSGDADMKKLAEILEPSQGSRFVLSDAQLSTVDVANILGEAPRLAPTEYDMILQYLRLTGRAYRGYLQLPHPSAALILPPSARRPPQFILDKRTYSCQISHIGNSAIQFYSPQTQSTYTGFIHTIWQIPLEDVMRTFILVNCHRLLSSAEAERAPYIHNPRLMSSLVDSTPSNQSFVIEPKHIITHLTTFKRPAGTYGINRETMVVCWALNRGRR